jgi:hypothetical protein
MFGKMNYEKKFSKLASKQAARTLRLLFEKATGRLDVLTALGQEELEKYVFDIMESTIETMKDDRPSASNSILEGLFPWSNYSIVRTTTVNGEETGDPKVDEAVESVMEAVRNVEESLKRGKEKDDSGS